MRSIVTTHPCLWALGAAIALSACTPPVDTVWQGTQADSAGVAVVVNPPAPLWSAADQWTVRRDLVIGEVMGGDPTLHFGNLRDVEVGPDGTIYGLDQFSSEVKMFDARGNYLGSFGGRGQGPGELTSNTIFLAALRSGILAIDPGLGRLSRFTFGGQYIDGLQLPREDGDLQYVGALPDGNVLAHQARNDMAWNGVIRIDLRHGSADTLLTFPRPLSPWGRVRPDASGRTRRLTHSPILTPLSDGRFVTAMSDEAEYQVRSDTGSVIRIVRRHEPNPTLSETEQQRYIDSLLGIWARMFRMEDQPEDWIRAEIERGRHVYIPPERLPAITGLLEGPESTVWVRKALPVEAMTSHVLYARPAVREFWGPTWEVYSGEGRFLGDVTFPPNLVVTRIEGDFAYGIELEDEFEVQRIARYHIVRPGA